MASPSSIREVRAIVSSTFATVHANAATDSWALTNDSVHKLRVIAADVSGLEQPGIEDETLQTRFHAKPKMIEGLAKGSLKLTTYAGGAYANVQVGPEWTLAAAAAGGIQDVTNARNAAAGAAVSTVNIAIGSVNTYVVAGQAVLVGVRGDGRGGGEVKPVNAVSEDHIGLAVATAGAATTDDTVTFSTTVYPDEDATQQYIDALVVGHAAADQVQTIGGAATFTVGGLGIGELPTLEFDVACADWQYAPSGARATISHCTTPKGGSPSFHRGTGVMHVGDYGSSTRTAYKVTDVSFDPGLVYEEVPSPSGGINGVAAFQHMPGSPTLECTILTAEDDGVLDDFPDTEKAVLLQFGSTATKCIALELPRCYLTARPQRVEVNNLTGWKLAFRGTEECVAGNDLRSAAWRIHIF